MTFNYYPMKYFKQQKWRKRSNLKHMSNRKALEIMWVNVKVQEKRKVKAFLKEIKTFQPKATLHLPTLIQLYPGQSRSAIPRK